MFSVNEDLSIYATRGDIVFFSVTAEDKGTAYKFQPGDLLRIKVFGKKDAESVVLQKDFPVTAETESVEVYLTEQDTKIGEVISKPKDYWYEVELNPFTNPQTIIGYDEDGAKVFKLFPEGDDIPEWVPSPEELPKAIDEELDLTSPRPVENRAIARAVVNLSGNFEKTKEEVTEKANTLSAAIVQTESEIAVERARLDNLVKSPAAADAELTDMRVGYDGVTHESAGTAVRQQFSKALLGVVHSINYEIIESSTYPLDMAIKKNTRYRVVVHPGENVSALDIGYTKSDGKDVLLVDNAVPGQEYEFTVTEDGTRFRFWTYLKEVTETTVIGSLTELGQVDRAAAAEQRISEAEASMYGYKARVTKDSFTIAQGFILEQFYKITPGRKFYVSFDSFNYDAIDKLNLYCNHEGGNEVFHDSLTPVIGEFYECYTENESVLNIYIFPTESGGKVDFTMSIYEENGVGKRLHFHEKDMDNLRATQDQVGLPYYEEHRKKFTVTDAWDIEFPTADDAKYIFKAEDYTGKNLTELQLYAFNSMQDYVQIKKGVQIGESVEFNGNSAYKYFRVYAVISDAEEQGEVLTIKLAEYNANSIIARLEALEDDSKNTVKAPNVLIIGDSYSQMGYWINELKNIVSMGDVVNLGVSSATLKDRFTDRTAYPYNSRPVSNDTRGGNVNTFGSQIEKLKRLMRGEDLDSGETKVFADSKPDIILIEGGANDAVDSSTDNYVSQIYTVEKGYIARKSDAAGYMGYIKIPTHYEDTDRTTFGGAMRYLYGVLHEMFPDAYIFFVTPCGLTYMSGGEHWYLKKGEQMKYAASLLGIPVIDWGVNGRLSLCDNAVKGSGTAEDPYIYDAAGEFSLDALHPNADGAHFLAMEVAKVLRDYNLVGYKK